MAKKRFDDVEQRYNQTQDNAIPYSSIGNEVLQELEALKTGERRTLAVSSSGLHGFEIAQMGLSISGDVTEDAWDYFGQLMAHAKNKWQWIIGDWLVFGQTNYGDKVYDRAAELFGGRPRTYEDYAYVARHVQFSERSENVPFILHKSLCTFGPTTQIQLLELAEQFALSQEIFNAIIPLYLDGEPYDYLLPGKITPVVRAELRQDKHRESVVKKGMGEQRDTWLDYAKRQADKWATVAKVIEDQRTED